jgi:hypothetical protein
MLAVETNESDPEEVARKGPDCTGFNVLRVIVTDICHLALISGRTLAPSGGIN